jgi:hypothetical protein
MSECLGSLLGYLQSGHGCIDLGICRALAEIAKARYRSQFTTSLDLRVLSTNILQIHMAEVQCHIR